VGNSYHSGSALETQENLALGKSPMRWLSEARMIEPCLAIGNSDSTPGHRCRPRHRLVADTHHAVIVPSGETPARRMPSPVSGTQLCAARTCLPRGGSRCVPFSSRRTKSTVQRQNFRILPARHRRDRVALLSPSLAQSRDRLVAEQERPEHTPPFSHTHVLFHEAS